MKESNYTRIIDQDGIELWVHYDYEMISDTLEFHGTHRMDEHHVELISVDVIIGSRGIDILPNMTESQQNIIKDLLSI